MTTKDHPNPGERERKREAGEWKRDRRKGQPSKFEVLLSTRVPSSILQNSPEAESAI